MRKYCVMTPTDQRTSAGLILFRLGLFKDGQEVDHMLVTSGQPGVQNLRTSLESVGGSAEPTPEGHYLLGDDDVKHLDGINWAGGPRNYAKLWPSIASPIWTGIHPADWGKMHPTEPRLSMGVHLDHPNGWPGTLGCVGLLSLDDCKKWVAWNEGNRVKELYVDHGLGFVELPKFGAVVEPVKHQALLYCNRNGLVLDCPNGLPAGQHQIYSPASGWKVELVPR